MNKSVVQKAREALSTLESEAHGLGMRSEYRHQLAADIRAGLDLFTTPGNGEWVRVPKGWKLVPTTPEPEMLIAAQRVIYSYDLRLIYKAMLKAAPQPPVQGGDESE